MSAIITVYQNIHYFECSKQKVDQNSFLASDFERIIRISTMFCSFFFQYFTHSLPMVHGTGWKFISPVYYDNFAFFQGGQDILIRVKFLIFLKKTGNFGSGNLNHKLSPRTCLFHNRDSHLFNDKNLWKTRELRLFFFNIQPF